MNPLHDCPLSDRTLWEPLRSGLTTQRPLLLLMLEFFSARADLDFTPASGFFCARFVSNELAVFGQ